MQKLQHIKGVRVTCETKGLLITTTTNLVMTHKNNSTLECLTLGDLLVRDSRKNQNQRFDIDSQIIASNFFGIKSATVRPQAKAKRNFSFEAELAIEWYFNGVESNFGFTKPIGVRKI